MRVTIKIYTRFIIPILVVLFLTPILLQSAHYLFNNHEHTHTHKHKVDTYKVTTISKAENDCAVCDFKFYLFTSQELYFSEFKCNIYFSSSSLTINKLFHVEKLKAKKGRAPPNIFLYKSIT